MQLYEISLFKISTMTLDIGQPLHYTLNTTRLWLQYSCISDLKPRSIYTYLHVHIFAAHFLRTLLFYASLFLDSGSAFPH